MISPPSISAMRVTTRFMNSRSWDVMSRAPVRERRNDSSHTIDSMSRWLVGSSIRSTSGLPEEDAGHGDAHLPAPGQGAHVAVDALVVEPQAVEDLARLRLQRVPAKVVVLLLHLAEARQDGVHLVPAVGIPHRVLQALELVVQVAHAAAARDGLVEHRAPGHLLDVLPEVPDGELPGNGDLPLVGGLLADDEPEQRGLPRAVGADQADLLAGVQLERRVDEEDLPAVLLAEMGKGDHARKPVQLGGV